jgi:hypothetical protein
VKLLAQIVGNRILYIKLALTFTSRQNNQVFTSSTSDGNLHLNSSVNQKTVDKFKIISTGRLSDIFHI